MRLIKSTHADGGQKRELPPPFRNPFVHDLRFTPVQKLQIGLMTVTVFPIRLFIAAFMMLLAWPFAFIASVGRSETTVEPQCLWRKVVDVVLKTIMRVMWFAGGFHWISVKGRRALPTEAPILTLGPHSSYFDAIPVTMTMASIVMKAESKDIPVWGTLIKFIRPVFVSRSDQDSRRKTVEEIKRRAHSGGEWPQIMIFPEGTCTNRSCLITFKPGAFIPAVPVQPVVIRYPNKLDTITWTWQGPGAFKILWLTLCQFHNEFQIEYLPIYSPSEEEKNNPALFAHNVRSLMAKALQVPVTDYSFEDCQLAMAEGQIKLPVDTCLLEFAKLVRSLGLKRENSEKLLQDYGNRAHKLQGERLSLEDFAEFLDLPVSDVLRDMFALFDEHEDNSVDVREFVIAFSVVCRPAKTLDTIRLAFKMFEAEEDGAITENELMCVLRTALGVGKLKVSRLFRAIDEEDTGKITFESFREFAEEHPEFAEQFLYSENAGFGSSSPPHANGFCADFSPRDHHAPQKKLD
ncbi:lysophosphatidylcholine acyltransferase 1 isoform X2 [Pimephales promelas]|uniref:lysophosphatidylcholine acyltransferase 1 isoform X1 n=1 Tax=Pimephales promelas TaxID=90988 RepID=UPI001955F204|nr:lysophosphatidylcholine acyltransferase 1 isoform X1 [Pimephales promelas]XP_039511091.1 lysophosphatidylcholine acyltransferase 1 isoform X2 [Pimephales promelas]KAG1930126.1 lysophosphatidylcholine acyltransferase [Pimephales promelas]